MISLLCCIGIILEVADELDGVGGNFTVLAVLSYMVLYISINAMKASDVMEWVDSILNDLGLMLHVFWR